MVNVVKCALLATFNPSSVFVRKYFHAPITTTLPFNSGVKADVDILCGSSVPSSTTALTAGWS